MQISFKKVLKTSALIIVSIILIVFALSCLVAVIIFGGLMYDELFG